MSRQTSHASRDRPNYRSEKSYHQADKVSRTKRSPVEGTEHHTPENPRYRRVARGTPYQRGEQKTKSTSEYTARTEVRHSFRPLRDGRDSTTSEVQHLVNVADDQEDREETSMNALMGFGGFGSTKGNHVPGNTAAGIAHAEKVSQARQYMNRKGGFNRPLE